MTSPKSSTTSKSTADAVSMLTDDHKAVKKLFKRFEKLKEDEGSSDEKESLVRQICHEIKVHAQIEEELFYPAVRKAIDDEDLMDEAEVEHAGARDLIEQLEGMRADDDLFDAKVTVLGEQIDHHVKEEEGEMFPKARKSELDTVALGEKMAERKLELMDEAGQEADAPPPRGGNGRKKDNADAVSRR